MDQPTSVTSGGKIWFPRTTARIAAFAPTALRSGAAPPWYRQVARLAFRIIALLLADHCNSPLDIGKRTGRVSGFGAATAEIDPVFGKLDARRPVAARRSPSTARPVRRKRRLRADPPAADVKLRQVFGGDAQASSRHRSDAETTHDEGRGFGHRGAQRFVDKESMVVTHDASAAPRLRANISRPRAAAQRHGCLRSDGARGPARQLPRAVINTIELYQ